ncbi:MAG: hypothetical protein ACOC4H_00085 [bacterium]
MNRFFIIGFLLLFVFNLFSYAGTEIDPSLKISQKYADESRRPVRIYDPKNGSFKGYIFRADLDASGKKEIIIPYTTRKTDAAVEKNADIFPQTLVIDVIRNGKITRNFMKKELLYTKQPKIYLTSAKLFENELPKLFLMADTGFKEHGINRHRLIFAGFDSVGKNRRKEFQTSVMPWGFILKQWEGVSASVNTFDLFREKNTGKFYIHVINSSGNRPKVSGKEISAFKKSLKKYRKNIYWEY